MRNAVSIALAIILALSLFAGCSPKADVPADSGSNEHDVTEHTIAPSTPGTDETKPPTTRPTITIIESTSTTVEQPETTDAPPVTTVKPPETTTPPLQRIPQEQPASGILDGISWKVLPELQYESVGVCCGEYDAMYDLTVLSPEEWIIVSAVNTVTGLLDYDKPFHGGHGGGGVESYFYDAAKSIFVIYENNDYSARYRYEEYTPDEFAVKMEGRFVIIQAIDINEFIINENLVWGHNTHILPEELWWNVKANASAVRGAEILTDFIYDYYHTWMGHWWDNEYIKLIKDGKQGLIDGEGNVIAPFIFEDIVYIDENTAFAKYNGRYGILDVHGTAALIR